MAQRSADQITLTDLTDGISVVLSSESFVFAAGITNAIAAQTTTKVMAFRGLTPLTVSINQANITKPANTTATVAGDVVTLGVTTAVTAGGEFTIPVVVEGGLQIDKKFSFSLAKTGATGTTGATGGQGPIGPGGVATGLMNEAHMIATNSAGTTTAAQTINVNFWAVQGGARVAVTATPGTLPAGITTTTNTPGTTGADGVLTFTVATNQTLGGLDNGVIPITLVAAGVSRIAYFSWAKAKAGVTGGQGIPGNPGAPGNDGAPGADGDDAVTLEVSSSNGLLFKNAQVSTVLTAKVFVGGVEVPVNATTGVVTGPYGGTVRWYKDGNFVTPLASAGTLTVSPGQVTNASTYEARLEY